MNIHHNALILVADGQKFLMLRNVGDFSAPVLIFEGGGDQTNPSTREQGTDQPGRAFASSGSRRSAIEQTDFHRIEKDHFAAEASALLGKLAQSGDFGKLIVVAPPQTLMRGSSVNLLVMNSLVANSTSTVWPSRRFRHDPASARHGHRPVRWMTEPRYKKAQSQTGLKL